MHAGPARLLLTGAKNTRRSELRKRFARFRSIEAEEPDFRSPSSLAASVLRPAVAVSPSNASIARRVQRRDSGLGSRAARPRIPPMGQCQAGLAENHAAAVKQSKIRIEKTIGTIRAYLKPTIVTAAKHMTSVHAVPRMTANVWRGRPPSCHANIAVNTRKIEKKSPKPTKKSQ